MNWMLKKKKKKMEETKKSVLGKGFFAFVRLTFFTDVQDLQCLTQVELVGVVGIHVPIPTLAATLISTLSSRVIAGILGPSKVYAVQSPK